MIQNNEMVLAGGFYSYPEYLLSISAPNCLPSYKDRIVIWDYIWEMPHWWLRRWLAQWQWCVGNSSYWLIRANCIQIFPTWLSEVSSFGCLKSEMVGVFCTTEIGKCSHQHFLFLESWFLTFLSIPLTILAGENCLIEKCFLLGRKNGLSKKLLCTVNRTFR
jgi:hypothetical protein